MWGAIFCFCLGEVMMEERRGFEVVGYSDAGRLVYGSGVVCR